jgi:predicted nucleic acid-binding protein
VKAVFADTSFFIALLDTDDDFHAPADLFSNRDRRPLLTTSAILLELGAPFRRAQDHPAFLAILHSLRAKHAEILHVDQALQESGTELFANRPDKDWSLVDCISFVLMNHRSLSDAATSDKHFEEAGFQALLRQPANP